MHPTSRLIVHGRSLTWRARARLSTAASSRPIWTKSMQHAMAQVIYWVVFHYLDLFTVHGVLAKRRFSSNERGQLLSQIYRISGYFSTFVEQKACNSNQYCNVLTVRSARNQKNYSFLYSCTYGAAHRRCTN